MGRAELLIVCFRIYVNALVCSECVYPHWTTTQAIRAGLEVPVPSARLRFFDFFLQTKQRLLKQRKLLQRYMCGIMVCLRTKSNLVTKIIVVASMYHYWLSPICHMAHNIANPIPIITNPHGTRPPANLDLHRANRRVELERLQRPRSLDGTTPFS